jgi:hypothetical protein
MADTNCSWRVAYTRDLGEKRRGINKKDAFQFFDDDEKGLIGLEYTACLEVFDPINLRWILVGRIIRKNSSHQYILVDNHGNEVSPCKLGRGILSTFLQSSKPSVYQFLSAINSPIAKDFKNFSF